MGGSMKLVFLLLISTCLQAQMLETIAMQGVMQQSAGAQTASDLSKAMKMIKQNDQMQQEALDELYTGQPGLFSQIKSLKEEIQVKYAPSYRNIRKNNLSYPYLTKYNWSVGPTGNGKFYIKINNLNKVNCEKLSFVGGELFVNDVKNSKCKKINNVKIIY